MAAPRPTIVATHVELDMREAVERALIRCGRPSTPDASATLAWHDGELVEK